MNTKKNLQQLLLLLNDFYGGSQYSKWQPSSFMKQQLANSNLGNMLLINRKIIWVIDYAVILLDEHMNIVQIGAQDTAVMAIEPRKQL